MGGSMPSTTQGNGSDLSHMFANSQGYGQPNMTPGYQQPKAVAPIMPPVSPRPLLPTPAQAAATTAGSILARNPPPPPMAAPTAAPKKPYWEVNPQRGGNGGNR